MAVNSILYVDLLVHANMFLPFALVLPLSLCWTCVDHIVFTC